MSVVIPERLAFVKDVPLSTGGHRAPADGQCPDGMCAVEKFAFITGQPWSDSPDNGCEVLRA